MSEKKKLRRLGPSQKVFVKVKGEIRQVDQPAFFQQLGKNIGFEADMARKIWTAAMNELGAFDLGDEAPPEEQAKANDAYNSARRLFLKHEDMRIDFKQKADEAAAKAKADKEAERVAFERAKIEASNQMVVAEKASSKIVNKVEDSLGRVITEGMKDLPFSYDGKSFTVKAGATVGEADVAKGFALVTGLANKAGDIVSVSSEMEGQYARLIRDELKMDWSKFFSDRPGDVRRVKNTVKTFDLAEEYDIDISGIPITNAQIVLQNVYNKDDAEDNLKRMKAVMARIRLLQKERGKVPSQGEIRTMVSEASGERKAKVFPYYAVFNMPDGSVKLVGQMEFGTPSELNTCDLLIARNGKVYNKSTQKWDPLLGYDEVPSVLDEARARFQREGGKLAEDEDEDDEELIEEAVEAPAKKAPKKKEMKKFPAAKQATKPEPPTKKSAAPVIIVDDEEEDWGDDEEADIPEPVAEVEEDITSGIDPDEDDLGDEDSWD